MNDILFRVIPAICFDCAECGNRHIKVERNLPDIIKTGVDCLQCRARYEVHWSDVVEQRRVILRFPGLISR